MTSIWTVLFFSLVGGIFSLIGGLLLIANKHRAKAIASLATPFAAGALLAAAFLDLLPETSHVGSAETGLQAALIGILVFFFLERFLRWFHHHHDDEDKHTDPAVSMIAIGDTLHNFIDGIAIAAGFLVDTQTGIIVTLAVAAHEIPQEIGDFGLLLHKGVRRKTALIINAVSALATTIAAGLFFSLGRTTDLPLDYVLGLVAGFFIYIAVSDIIPSIHKSEKKALAGRYSALLLAGVLAVFLTTSTLHGIIESGDIDHDHSHTSEHDKEDHSHEDDHDHEEDEHHDENDHME